MYKVFTLPTCEHCHEAIQLMKEKRIDFEQVDTGSSKGYKEFVDFYKTNRNQIQRDNSGCAVLPIIYRDNDSGLHQGTDGLAKFLGI
jgi:glutaredoxin